MKTITNVIGLLAAVITLITATITISQPPGKPREPQVKTDPGPREKPIEHPVPNNPQDNPGSPSGGARPSRPKWCVLLNNQEHKFGDHGAALVLKRLAGVGDIQVCAQGGTAGRYVAIKWFKDEIAVGEDILQFQGGAQRECRSNLEPWASGGHFKVVLQGLWVPDPPVFEFELLFDFRPGENR